MSPLESVDTISCALSAREPMTIEQKLVHPRMAWVESKETFLPVNW